MHDDELFRQIREATAEDYNLLGELGRDSEGRAYLARDLSSRDLVVLQVRREADALEVLPALTDAVPVSGGVCPACGSALQSWSEPCPGCGQSLAEASTADSPEVMWERVVTAAADSYHVRGSLDRVGGAGRIYFAHERATNRLVGLVIQPADPQTGGDEVLNEVWSQPADASAAIAGQGASTTGVMETMPRKRSRLPVAAMVLMLLAPVVVGVAWLSNRGDAEVPPPTTDSATSPVVVSPPPPAGQGGGAGGSATGRDTIVSGGTIDSVDGGSAVPPPPTAAPDEQLKGIVTIDAFNLPSDWMRIVNAGKPSRLRTIELTPDREATIRVEANGYCPYVVRMKLKPGEKRIIRPTLPEAPLSGC